MSEFFHMGGYAAYVWPSYFLAFVVLVANLVVPFYRTRRIKRMLVRRSGPAGRSK